MILKGSQRSGAARLGRHLLNDRDNEHVTVHEVSGFTSEDVMGALQEAEIIASGTRCKQHLFSVSFSPPPTEVVRTETFEHAINEVERRTNLTGQPRVIVFHEKEGRRHAHCVWSRIDASTMTAVHLPHFGWKLRDLSREIYLENGWKLPPGLVNSKARDFRNFNLAEWQQAKRIGRDPRELKELVRECWAASDTKESFARALRERGLHLARGDSRAHVAVTSEGAVLSIARSTGSRAKEISARLGDLAHTPSVAEARAIMARELTPKLRDLLTQANAERDQRMASLTEERRAMAELHARERLRLDEGLDARAARETRERALRLHTNIRGLWQRLTGEAARVRKANEAAAYFALQRDLVARDELIAEQLRERQHLQQSIQQERRRHTARVTEIHRDLAKQREALIPVPEASARIEARDDSRRGQGTERSSRPAFNGASGARPNVSERLNSIGRREAPAPTRSNGPELER